MHNDFHSDWNSRLKCFDSDIMNKALDLFWSNTIHIEIKSSENGEKYICNTFFSIIWLYYKDWEYTNWLAEINTDRGLDFFHLEQHLCRFQFALIK